MVSGLTPTPYQGELMDIHEELAYAFPTVIIVVGLLWVASLIKNRSDRPADSGHVPGCTHGGDCPVHPDVQAVHNFDGPGPN